MVVLSGCHWLPLIVDIYTASTTEYPMFFPVYAWVAWNDWSVTGITGV